MICDVSICSPPKYIGKAGAYAHTIIALVDIRLKQERRSVLTTKKAIYRQTHRIGNCRLMNLFINATILHLRKFQLSKKTKL